MNECRRALCFHADGFEPSTGRRGVVGESPDMHGILLGALPAVGGSSNIRQAYSQPTAGIRARRESQTDPDKRRFRGRTASLLRFVLGHHSVNGFSPEKSAILS